MVKISTLINDALIDLNVINAIDEANPEDHSFALRTLNRLIGLYNTQNLIVSYMQNVEFLEPVTGWTSPILIGEGEQYPSTAPISIDAAFFSQGDTDYPMRRMSSDQWADIGFKQIRAIPRRLYPQRMGENKMKISFDVIPMSGLILHLLCKMPINSGVAFDATDEIEFEYGVEKLLQNRLSLELCTTYEAEPNIIQMLASKVQEAEKQIKTANFQPLTMRANKTLSKKRTNTRNRARF